LALSANSTAMLQKGNRVVIRIAIGIPWKPAAFATSRPVI